MAVRESLGQDVLMSCGTKEDDWGVGGGVSLRDCRQTSFGVVLRDRLMTDAALGGPKPIKSEHSYSLLACSPPPPSCGPVGGVAPPSGLRVQQQAHRHQVSCTDVAGVFAGTIVCTSEPSRLDVTDMEEECFPAISMNTASGRDSSRSSPEPFSSVSNGIELTRPRHLCDNISNQCTIIKGEPLSAPCSPCTSDATILLEDKSTVAISPHNLHLTGFSSQTSDSEDDDEDMHQEIKVETLELPCEDDAIDQTSNQDLPPTPPSSASSDSEGTVSASCSPERRDSHGSVHVQSLRGFLQPRLYVTTNGAIGQHGTSTRQPIHTPLISCQPKGSTGILVLTEEEKRTLIAEGYPVPTKLPLTKQEEKSLKKVRRKIKNKISAQESRRKKKEYMDGLERRVTLLTNENSSYREKVSTLETTNRQLLKELQRLQAIIQRKSS
ncbi:PREDICTED: cyclic AMP response element-binding protein A isoform X2 [Ceratosolen solmsi marchali]|uniref:Cyclic AMP response element-binding protein A isoform X2 n=1 Tax=Ceratosolen solmsi marchali TaxID=326594 RepID=A0AAJ7DZB5_9HYME|nr:PREDICTED: cyclic AMP response element-binding protein A isoform X2 [Ceratosolen solmsi marchali]